MKDDKGLYYYPDPGNKKARVYVRKIGSEIHFRLWKQDDPQLWDVHGWVPYSAIKKAAAMFKGQNFDPLRAYDMVLATHLISEAENEAKQNTTG